MEYITNFGEYLIEKGKADKTVESYTGDLVITLDSSIMLI